ncbi:MAG TPA: acetate/propionate family kinase [Vicinamibacterales bacterium]|nr:acetate/propionate family kinase [Vicinamibacterales bacterium]
MTDAILVLNAGSSSIKFSLFGGGGGDPALVAGGQVSGIYTAPWFVANDAAGRQVGEKRWDAGVTFGHDAALDHIVHWIKAHAADGLRLAAVGHRVTHGGSDYAAPVRIDRTVVARLAKLIPLSPLHLPHNLAPIRTLLERAPELPQIACFDTAMHRTNPPIERMFALPRELDDAGVRRYGFHGLSYEYIAGVLPRFDERAARGKTIVLHLGSGASMCALAAGRSVATTMGFTAVDGLPMGTRCGAIDPGVILYLMDQRGMDARAIETLIYKQSGLLGVSGVSSDMRALHASKEPRAALAIDLFVHSIGRQIGSLAAALGGLDAIVFTAGIGEHDAVVRERVCRQAAWLGIELDARANAAGGPRISTPASRTAAWVIPTNEELVIARHTRDLLAAEAQG